jgi:hypothetical protein
MLSNFNPINSFPKSLFARLFAIWSVIIVAGSTIFPTAFFISSSCLGVKLVKSICARLIFPKFGFTYPVPLGIKVSYLAPTPL